MDPEDIHFDNERLNHNSDDDGQTPPPGSLGRESVENSMPNSKFHSFVGLAVMIFDLSLRTGCCDICWWIWYGSDNLCRRAAAAAGVSKY
ncbi:hypothetical protein RHGRI_023904 [Rhododendron griersonianum]|uniref:Uncharacterized protein n=1 Tax=Rhododendron griersonianum TaxID=479676 RepID=A0AAV6JAR8_9ERIC|nr:hypothetical protein RHGRI_023904 [Rhododendron griersonianum]